MRDLDSFICVFLSQCIGVDSCEKLMNRCEDHVISEGECEGAISKQCYGAAALLCPGQERAHQFS